MIVHLRPGDLRFDPPDLSPATVAAIARDRFGVEGTLTPLRGERDHNTRIVTAGGEAFVLRVASPGEDHVVLDFQCAALEHVARRDPGLGVPRVVPTVEGARLAAIEIDGTPTRARLLTFLPGITFADVAHVSPGGLHDIGAFQGRLAHALRDLDHPGAAHFMPWALDSGLLSSEELWTALPPSTLRVLAPCRDRVDRAVAATAAVRRQVVHNDGHRGNLLRADAASEAVTGVIDFGDLVETALVADLAIQATGFVGRQPDAGAALCALTAGYHASMPLRHNEIDLLAELVLCRFVLSALLAEYQVVHAPHIAAPVADELPELLDALDRWATLDAAELTDRMHEQLATAD